MLYRRIRGAEAAAAVVNKKDDHTRDESEAAKNAPNNAADAEAMPVMRREWRYSRTKGRGGW